MKKEVSNMVGVYPAKPYVSCCLGSLDRTAHMYLRQFQFPNVYDGKLDNKIMADSDRTFLWDHQHARRCFQQHTGTGELGFERWILSTTDKAAMEFLKDILKADESVEWTGYRVTGSVHQGNGYPVWTLELFAKHPESETQVYTGENAPNVRGKRPSNRW